MTGKMSYDRAPRRCPPGDPAVASGPGAPDTDSADAWLNLLADADLAAHLPPEAGPDYAVPNDEQDGGPG